MKNTLLAALLTACAAPVALADYPDQPIRIIVPFAAGGGTDVMGRMFAQKLSDAWKVPVTVDNRAGAGGTIGSATVARAPADGYTLLLGSISTHAISPGLYAKLAYDPVKDFAAVARAGITPFVMTVHPGVPAGTIGELISLARANPKKYDYASSGNGTTSHLCGALFTQMAGVDMTHVPYKANAPGLTDLLAGRVTFMFDNIIAMQPHIRAGKLRVHAVTTARPAAALPGVPPMSNFVPGFDTDIWYGAWLPAGVQKPVLDRWLDELRKVHSHPDVRAAFERDGADAIFMPPAEFAAFLKKEVAKYAELVKRSGARATD